jgi:hypothetical protein
MASALSQRAVLPVLALVGTVGVGGAEVKKRKRPLPSQPRHLPQQGKP